MEFPLTGMIEMNGSGAAVGRGGSLYGREPVVAASYVGVLGLAAVVGTLGNLVVIITVIMKELYNVGGAFIANLASSDMIVASVVNPLAIAGLSMTCCAFDLIAYSNLFHFKCISCFTAFEVKRDKSIFLMCNYCLF